MLKYLVVACALVVVSPAFGACEIGGCATGFVSRMLPETSPPDPKVRMIFSTKCPECRRGCSRLAYQALCFMRKRDTVWEGTIAERAAR